MEKAVIMLEFENDSIELVKYGLGMQTTEGLNETHIDLIKQPLYMIVVLSFAYGLVLVVTLAGNLCVVGVVYKDKHFHTPTYVFIVNLAVADLSVAVFCLPVTLLSNLYNGKISIHFYYPTFTMLRYPNIFII